MVEVGRLVFTISTITTGNFDVTCFKVGHDVAVGNMV